MEKAARMEFPAVSVVIPIFNGEQYLRKTLESVFAQTYRNYEVICVDDGSTDGSPAILQSYAGSVTVLRQANAGQSAARNAGVRSARGNYVAFLDQDDLWYAHKLERQVRVLDDQPDVVLVHCDEDWIDPSGTVLRRGVTGANRVSRHEALLTKLMGKEASFIMPSAMLIRRETFERIGGFDSSLQGYEDFDLCIRLRLQGLFVFQEESGICYRMHSGGFNRMGGERLFVSGERFYRRLESLFADNHSKRVIVNQLLAQLYSDWGKSKMRSSARSEGRRLLLRSLHYHPWRLRTYSRLFRSLLPIL
jgi:glycosyltransferase involved in cell wall biosynthesis